LQLSSKDLERNTGDKRGGDKGTKGIAVRNKVTHEDMEEIIPSF
jgi:hypothetical protein